MIKKHLQRLGINQAGLLCTLLLIVNLSTFLLIVFSRGSLLPNYFHKYSFDTSMDFFNVLAASARDDLYLGDGYNYPPFCMFMMKCIHYIVPAGVPTIDQINQYGGDGLYLRTFQNALFAYLLIITTCVLIIALCLIHILKGSNNATKWPACLVVLTSGPFLYMLERGNVIIIALMGTLIFTVFYESESAVGRCLALLSLAVAASIKLYPAVFSIMLLRKRRYKEFLLFVIVFAIIFIVPFWLYGGIDAIFGFIRGLGDFTQEFSTFGMGLQYGMSNMLKIVKGVTGIALPASSSTIGIVIALILCVIAAVKSEQDGLSLLLLGGLCVIVPSISFTYALTFLIPGFIVLVRDFKQRDFGAIAVLGLVGLCLLIYVFPLVPIRGNLPDAVQYPLYVGCLIGNIALYGMILLALIISICAPRGEKTVGGDMAE